MLKINIFSLVFLFSQFTLSSNDPFHFSEFPKYELWEVVGTKDLEEVKSLLAEGMDPNIRNSYGNTPLHRAVGYEIPALVELLLESGADPNLKNDNSIAPLYIAVDKASKEITKILLENGADPNMKNHIGDPPLNRAVMLAKYAYRPDLCADSFDSVKLLLENGADLNIKDSEDRTPLYIAISCIDPDSVKLLLSNGADPKEGADLTGIRINFYKITELFNVFEELPKKPKSYVTRVRKIFPTQAVIEKLLAKFESIQDTQNFELGVFPSDIWIEIAKYIDEEDMKNLAGASKALVSFFYQLF